MPNRRHAIGLLSVGFVGMMNALPAAGRAPIGDWFLMSSFTGKDDRHYLRAVGLAGDPIFTIDLPGRGHGVVFSEGNTKVVLFARRPGTFALVADSHDPSNVTWIEAPPDRHFYGHGCFSPDGRLLYATENDFDNARGVIGVYDARDSFRRIGEFDTHGTGPHEMILMGDGETLAVANGGIETHPDFPRQKLNLPEMKSSVALIRRRDGSLVAQEYLQPDHQLLSLRHLCQDHEGNLWLAGQYQGPLSDPVGTLAIYRLGQALSLIDPPGLALSSKRYLGTIRSNRAGNHIAVTGPRGNLAMILDAGSGRTLTQFEIEDVCGISRTPEPASNGFLFSDGKGRIWRDGKVWRMDPTGGWDNHMTLVS